MKWIKKLIAKYYMWKLKQKYKHLRLTPQGEYFIKYIIDYYINETTTEPIDRYEAQITALSEKIKLPATEKPIPDDLKPGFLHYHAAILTLRGLLFTSEHRNEWLQSINDSEIKAMISNPLYIINEVQ